MRSFSTLVPLLRVRVIPNPRALLAVAVIVQAVVVPAFGEPASGEYSFRVEHDVIIPMRDGVRLAADIYLPTDDDGQPIRSLPILLQRTPYDKTTAKFVEAAEFFASHGYIAVLQDARGRYQSDGEFSKYIGEGQDGFDTIEHLALLPYTNGKIGMWGTSYGAHVQANAAKFDPPHLRTIVLNMGGLSNGWTHKIRNHGALELQQVTWAFTQLAAEARDPILRQMISSETPGDWLWALPFRRGLNPFSTSPNFEDYLLKVMTDTDYGDFWKEKDLNWVEHYHTTADIPMLLLTGWYDSYCGGTIQNFIGLTDALNSHVQLIVGPWTHGGNLRSYAGDIEFGANANLSGFERDFHLRWFDKHLKDIGSQRADPKVKLFVMGTGDGHKDRNGRLFHGGHWITTDSWPLPNTQFTKFYLVSGGKLQLAPDSSEAASTTYTFDPTNPVPTIGGAFSSTGPTFEPGGYDQRTTKEVFAARPPYLPLKARSDVVVFQTDPLPDAVEVVGPISIKLYVSSSAVDTDFTVKLVDVYPPSLDYPQGFDLNITDGVLRTRYRASQQEQVLLQPGKIVELSIQPFPTANVFKKGHRIRIDISSSNFPRFDINPNTGEPLGTHRSYTSADNTIYHDSLRRSHLLLPIVSADSSTD